MLTYYLLATSAILTSTYAQLSTNAPSEITPAPSATAVGEETIISVFLWWPVGGTSRYALYGSIVDNDDDATTMSIDCEWEEGGGCRLYNGDIVTQGPSTFAAEHNSEGFLETVGCDITGSTEASCSRTYPREEPNGTDFLSTDAASFNAKQITYHPVIITAGSLRSGVRDEESSATEESTARETLATLGPQTSSSSDDSSDASRVGMVVSGGFAGVAVLVMLKL